MNRSGRSLPAGPASTPHASSGWSRRAWATIWSCSARGMLSMGLMISAERLDERLLHRAQPGVHLERGPLRVVLGQLPPLLLEVLGDPEADAEGEPDVVQRLEPGDCLLAGELDAAARHRQGGQHVQGGLVLGAAQRGLGVLAELPRRLRVVAVP